MVLSQDTALKERKSNMAREKLIRNRLGEYNYHFNWMNEHGSVNGFNDVWAANKREAVKKARAMEDKAHWALYDQEVGHYVVVPQHVNNGEHCFRNSGMYLKRDTMYRATQRQADAANLLGWSMTN